MCFVDCGVCYYLFVCFVDFGLVQDVDWFGAGCFALVWVYVYVFGFDLLFWYCVDLVEGWFSLWLVLI